MKKSKFNQVVLPVIIAGIVSMIIIRIVSYIVFPNPHEVEDSVNQEEYNSEQLKNNEEVFIQPDVMTVEEEDTSLTIGNVCLEDYLKENPDVIDRANTISELVLDGAFSSNCLDIIEGDVEPTDGEIIPLDLTSLSMFPNLKTLSITGLDLTNNLYEDVNNPIYFSLDLETLKQFRNLTHLNLEFVKIDNFAPLGETSLHSLAIKSCDFTTLEEQGYEQLNVINELTLSEDNLGLKMNFVFKSLKNIKVLDIRGVKADELKNVEYEKGMKNLESLTLSLYPGKQEIYDKMFNSMPKLQKLDITYEQAEENDELYEIQSLADLTELKELTIQGRIKTISNNKSNNHYSYLKSLSNLTSLTLHDLELEDISFLSDLTGLIKLDLSYNYIGDISPLVSLKNLESLDLSFNRIESIDALTGLTNLKALAIGNNFVKSIEALRNMKELESFEASSGLYYQGDPTYSYENIFKHYYNNMEYGMLESNELRGYNPKCIKDILEGAESVFVTQQNQAGIGFNFFDSFMADDGNYITLSPYSVHSIWGSNRNTIEDLSPLQELSNLVFLDVSGNCVRDLSTVKGLKKLIFLGCMDNKIEDVSFITAENFPALKYVYLSQNNIKEAENLIRLEYDLDAYVQFYMTPFYNRYYYSFKELRKVPVYAEIGSINLVGIFSNALTGIN